MRFKTWPVAALGLASLLLLIVASLLTSSRKAEEIYAEIEQLDAYHHTVDTKLRRLRSDIHLSAVFIRDALLDTAGEYTAEYRPRLREFRRTSNATVQELRAVAGQHEDRIQRLQVQLEDYWRVYEPLLAWTPSEKIRNSASVLRREVVPRREAVMALAYELEALNEASLTEQRAAASQRHAAFQRDLSRLLWQTILLGLAVALVAVFRLHMLERASEGQRLTAEHAEQQMRQLSQRLVATQEAERKNLSRELHDDIAQVLTALKMELGRIDRASTPGDTRLGSAVVECRRLVDNMFRTVRSLASGLRPSMLDDLGLQATLEWHVRDFTSRFGVNVQLTTEGDFGHLPDRYGVCVYRTIQEALTNCARHSGARSVSITVVGRPDRVEVRVADDGIGIDPARRQDGLGLRGIEERVRELGGTVTISGVPGKGTLVAFCVPLVAHTKDVSLASAVS